MRTKTNPNKLTKYKFDYLVHSMPSISVHLEWDCNYGKYQNKNHEIEFGNFFVSCDLLVHETGTITSSTYYSPAEYNVYKRTVEVGYIEVWYNENEVELTTSQQQKLRETIKSSVL